MNLSVGYMSAPSAIDSAVEAQQYLTVTFDGDPLEVTSASTLENLSSEQSTVFQAIGCLYGKVIKNEEGQFFIQLGRQPYKLYVLRNKYRAWIKQIQNAPDTALYLKVYPKFLAIPRQPVIISFQVIAWSTEPLPTPLNEEPGIFTIRGIWQFLPQFRVPCLSIYRNSNAIDFSEKFKAVHLPVLMRREDSEVRPFKFNPKIAKDQLPKKWFIQGRFKFIPSKECFGWVYDLQPPTQKLPKYKKPVKAEPTLLGDETKNRNKPVCAPSLAAKPNSAQKYRPVIAAKRSTSVVGSNSD